MSSLLNLVAASCGIKAYRLVTDILKGDIYGSVLFFIRFD